MSKYALLHIAKESNWVEYVGLNKYRCGCTFISTYNLPCVCELASFGVGSILLQSVHFICTQLSFSDTSSHDTSAESSIQQKFDVIMNRFKEVDFVGKVNIKAMLREIEYPNKTSLCPPIEKVKTKGAKKGRTTKFVKSTKWIPSYFQHVDATLTSW